MPDFVESQERVELTDELKAKLEEVASGRERKMEKFHWKFDVGSIWRVASTWWSNLLSLWWPTGWAFAGKSA